MSLTRWTLSWLIAGVVVVLRATCKTRLHDDPRQALRSAKVPYAFSVLHAHQIAAVINREPGTAAMVSRSADGQLLIPAFYLLGVKAVRGSSNTHKNEAHQKGGLPALRQLAEHIRIGCPAYLAVDGPRGPRNQVKKGIAVLAKLTGVAVLNVVAIPQHRWIIRGAWDRFQIPKPFSRVDGYFGEPLFYENGEGIESFRSRVEAQLRELEKRHDAEEAQYASRVTNNPKK